MLIMLHLLAVLKTTLKLPSTPAITILVLVVGSLVGCIGNGLVIAASHKYGTLKLDRVTVVLVRNLAIADLVSLSRLTATSTLTKFVLYIAT